MNKFAFGLLAVVAIQVASPASAQITETRSQRVSFADLNLSSPAGQAKLSRRIRSAVDAICGRPGVREAWELRDIARCRREANQSASPQVASAIARSGNPVQMADAGKLARSR